MVKIVNIISIILVIPYLLVILLESLSCKRVRDLKVPKKKFILLVLKWCASNLGTINHRYELKIHYYGNKKYSGRYFNRGKQIVIYVVPNLRLIDLVDTVIHEYIHYLQFVNKSVEKDYNKQLSDVGYWKVKYEVEAREMAKKYRDNCFNSVMNEIGMR